MRNRKLRNIRNDRRSRDPFGSVHGVFSTTSASYNHRKPHVLYEKAGHAQNLFPIRTASGQGHFRSRDFVTSCQKAPLGRIWRNFRFNIRSDQRSRDPFGSVIVVFSTTSASYDPRKLCVLYLAWSLELALVICPLLFSYSAYVGCVVLLRVHLVENTTMTLPKGSRDLWSLRMLHNFRLRMRTPRELRRGSSDLRSHLVALLLLLKKKRGERRGMRRTYFRTGPLKPHLRGIVRGIGPLRMTGSDVT
jgi:hypothetical protein